jgi:hypothetical protein
LLAHLLRVEHHFDIGSPLPPNALSADASHLSLFKDASLVCLSLISTSSPARARYLVRRIRRRAPRARILVGFWGSPAKELAKEAAFATSAQIIAFSLRDALSEIYSPMEERMPAA